MSIIDESLGDELFICAELISCVSVVRVSFETFRPVCFLTHVRNEQSKRSINMYSNLTYKKWTITYFVHKHKHTFNRFSRFHFM